MKNRSGSLSAGWRRASNIVTRNRTVLWSATLAAALVSPLGAAAQGIPVMDMSNLAQNIESAVQSVAQTEKQIQQYRLQLQQYQTMLRNSMAPAAYIWGQAKQTIAQLQDANNTLTAYKKQLGSLNDFLANFQSVGQYATSPCFKAGGCSAAQQAQLQQQQTFALNAQKAADDAAMRGLDQQQQNVAADAQRLTKLQAQAQSATGQMQALQAANQLASEQDSQLLQIRQLLIAQQTAVTTQMEAQNAAHARAAAATAAQPDHYVIVGPGANSDPLAESLKASTPGGGQ